jgi:bacterioferritin-associated ferredoxin
MYICVCQAVSDQQIRIAVCKGACSMRDLCKDLGVATRCGRCRSHAEALLQETLDGLAANDPTATLAVSGS